MRLGIQPPQSAIHDRGYGRYARLDAGCQASKKSSRPFVLVFRKGNEEGAVRQFLRSLLSCLDRDRSAIQQIDAMRLEFASMSDDKLRALPAVTNNLLQFMAAAAV